MFALQEQWFCKGVKDKNGKTSPNRGYLEENIRNWRQRLSATDKAKYGIKTYSKNKPKISSPKVPCPMDIEVTLQFIEKQQWLKENHAPADIVSQYMSETALERHQHIIASRPSITDILESWPKLLHVDLVIFF